MCNEHYKNDNLCKCERIKFNKEYRRRVKACEPLLKRGRKRKNFFAVFNKNAKIRELEKQFGMIYCRDCEELKPINDMVKDKRNKSGVSRLCKQCKAGNKLWKCCKCGASKNKADMRDAGAVSHKTKIHICLDCPVDISIRHSVKKAFDPDYQFGKYLKNEGYNPYFAKAMGWFARHNDELKSCLVGYDTWRWSYIDETLHPILKNQPNNVRIEVKTDKWRNLPFKCGSPDIEPNGYTFEEAHEEWGEKEKGRRK